MDAVFLQIVYSLFLVSQLVLNGAGIYCVSAFVGPTFSKKRLKIGLYAFVSAILLMDISILLLNW